MLPFFVFGTLLVVGIAGIITMIHINESESLLTPLSVLIALAGLIGSAISISEAGAAKDALRKAEYRGLELRELIANIDNIKDHFLKANTIVEAFEWNRVLSASKVGNASQWSDYFWADGWANLKPIEIK